MSTASSLARSDSVYIYTDEARVVREALLWLQFDGFILPPVKVVVTVTVSSWLLRRGIWKGHGVEVDGGGFDSEPHLPSLRFSGVGVLDPLRMRGREIHFTLNRRCFFTPSRTSRPSLHRGLQNT